MPEVRRDKFVDGVIHSKTDFAERACTRPSPFATADAAASERLDSDLTYAIEYITQRGEAIVGDRKDRLKELTRSRAHASRGK